MYRKEDAQELVHHVVALCRPHDAHASLWMEHLEGTAFADNRLQPDTLEQSETLYLRVHVDGREATVCTRDLDRGALQRLAEEAVQQARSSSARGVDYPLPGAQQYPQLHAFNASTALWTCDQRSEGIRAVIEQALSGGLVAEGEYYTATRQVTLANSVGLQGCEARTDAGLMVWAHRPGGASGYGDGYARDAKQINPLEVAEQAISKALLGGDPVTVGPGRYEVVLEHNAVADLLSQLAPGFGAQAVADGRSFVPRSGEELTSPRLSITEDPLHPDGFYSAFDSEGTCRQAVPLVENGLAQGAVYDLRTGAAVGRSSTGHSPAPLEEASSGPVPCSLFMDHADEEVEALIAAVQRGLLITHFRNVEVVDLARARLRGLACEGTFLIENGVITNPVQDLHFEEDVWDAFRTIDLISRERKLVMQGLSRCTVVPALKLSRFNFTGSTSQSG